MLIVMSAANKKLMKMEVILNRKIKLYGKIGRFFNILKIEGVQEVHIAFKRVIKA